jgi:hypothetical protein
MPVVTTCVHEVSGAKFEAKLKVDTKGVFNIQRPGTTEDWPEESMTIAGRDADTVIATWKKAVVALVTKSKVEQRVILVCFDSILRHRESQSAFLDRNVTLHLRCRVCLRITTKQGDKVSVGYRPDPEYDSFGFDKKQPFPSLMTIPQQDIGFNVNRSCAVVEWTKELEDMLVNACQHIEKLVRVLDGALSTEEALKAAVLRLGSQTPLLGLAPQTLNDKNV